MLSQRAQGSGQHQRVGNRIVIKEYKLDVYINLTRDATTEPQDAGGTTTPPPSTGTYTRPTHITMFLGYTKAGGKQDTEMLRCFSVKLLNARVLAAEGGCMD